MIESVTNQIEKVVVGNATRIMKAVVRLIRQELGRIVEDVNEKDIESVGSESYRVDLYTDIRPKDRLLDRHVTYTILLLIF